MVRRLLHAQFTASQSESQLHVSLRGYAGSTTGQSHLLDDIVDNLQMDESSNAEPYYARRIFTYAIGSQHSLYESLANAVHHQ